MGGGNTPPIPKDKFVEYDKNGNIDLTEKGDVILGENKELLGTDYDDTQHILASIKTYEVNEQPFVQNELANDTNHTNINSKDRPTIETPTEKKEVAYLSDITKENV
ncbi:MAG: hypothetical protein LBG59_08960 [Candidatus Peribacteria bacterium]|jgi:predicted HTH domain antitoxin|nr:hypothetical protein [Candidatus Peribacteria bacterium]